MAEILRNDGVNVAIGTDDGRVVTVPIGSINFADPKVGDKVKLYQDGENYIIQKDTPALAGVYQAESDGVKKINKHIFVWVGGFLFGGLGVDRFLRGQIGIGICKILFGWLTFGIWPFVDWLISIAKAYGSAYGNVEEITFDKNGKYTR
jgi:TM2 domain-containing membrane protein YozV